MANISNDINTFLNGTVATALQMDRSIDRLLDSCCRRCYQFTVVNIVKGERKRNLWNSDLIVIFLTSLSPSATHNNDNKKQFCVRTAYLMHIAHTPKTKQTNQTVQ